MVLAETIGRWDSWAWMLMAPMMRPARRPAVRDNSASMDFRLESAVETNKNKSSKPHNKTIL
jgi:hypothetical protein